METSAYQERGGPRSVSGNPTDETAGTHWLRVETFPLEISSGTESAAGEKSANWSCWRPRMLHPGGGDFNLLQDADAIAVPALGSNSL
jgi:hypothetical protein